jgi:hypothetical protein
MVMVSNAVLFTGASNIGGSKKNGLKLSTNHGNAFFKKKHSLYKVAVKANTVDFYKKYLYNEREEVRKQLSHFLNDDQYSKLHKMDDKDIEGWDIYKKMVDEWDVLTYFMEKKNG